MEQKKKLKKWIKTIKIRFLEFYSEDSCTESKLYAQLKAGGIMNGDRIMVHSSLSKIGYVNGGAEALISALKRAVGEKGMLVMPTFPAEGTNFEYIKRKEIFDAQKTPSKMGAVTEAFRKCKGVYRSIHPTHPVAAWGHGADKFVKGHYKSIRPFGKGTPFEKIYKDDFKILLIGVDFENMTACRIIEDLEEDFPFNPYLNELYSAIVKDERNNIVEVKLLVHDPEISRNRKNMILFPYMNDKKMVKRLKLGSADCYLVHTKDVYKTQMMLSEKDIFTYYSKIRG